MSVIFDMKILDVPGYTGPTRDNGKLKWKMVNSGTGAVSGGKGYVDSCADGIPETLTTRTQTL